MIKGLGVDILKISKIKHNLDKYLSEEEKQTTINMSETKKQEFLAGRFAAKEAIFKAWDGCPKDFSDINIISNGSKPHVEGNKNLLLSISHDGDYVVAFCTFVE